MALEKKKKSADSVSLNKFLKTKQNRHPVTKNQEENVKGFMQILLTYNQNKKVKNVNARAEQAKVYIFR